MKLSICECKEVRDYEKSNWYNDAVITYIMPDY